MGKAPPQFGTCFIVFPFCLLFVFVPMYLVDLQKLWCSRKSERACDWPWATCLEVSAIHSLWLPLLSWECAERTKLCSRLALTDTGPGEGQFQIFQIPAFACSLSVRLNNEIASSCTP